MSKLSKKLKLLIYIFVSLSLLPLKAENSLYDALTEGILSQHLDQSKQIAGFDILLKPANDLSIINSLSNSQSMEGFSGDDLIDSGTGFGVLFTKEEMNYALEEAEQSFTMAEKLTALLDGIAEVRKISGGNFYELLPRMILNRCEELVHISAPLSTRAGTSDAEGPEAEAYFERVQKYYVTFLKRCYQMADVYLQERTILRHSNYFTEKQMEFIDQYAIGNNMGLPTYEDLQMIDFARRTAKMMFDLTKTSDLTESAQSVMMVKILQNLARDIQDDVRTNNDRRIQSIIEFIARIQHRHKGFRLVLELVKNNVGPKSIEWQRATGLLRSRMEMLFEKRLDKLVIALNEEGRKRSTTSKILQ